MTEKNVESDTKSAIFNSSKLSTHEIVTLVEYHLNWMKIVELLLIGYF